MTSSSVLITGHTGLVGSWLGGLLNAKGVEVFGFSREKLYEGELTSYLVFEGSFQKEYWGAVEDQNAISRAIADCKPDTIIHLAAQSQVIRGYEQPYETYTTNTLGTISVAEQARLSGISNMIFVSTDKVYAPAASPRAETDLLGASDPYSLSKIFAEQALDGFRDKFLGTHVCIVRGGNVIGGGDWSDLRLVPDIVRAYRSSRKSLLLRNPTQRRPWQHVLDFAYGIALLVEKNSYTLVDPNRPIYRINFGSESQTPISSQEVAQTFQALGWNFEIMIGPASYSETTFLALAVSRAQADFGWTRRLDDRQLLSSTFDWYSAAMKSVHDASEVSRFQIAEYLSKQ